MAPCAMTTLDHQASNGLRKLRKPVIEKMRRDRINSSIEQLRVLLEKEFQKHQLPSKPEKADILEMTVALLQQRMAEKTMTTVSSQARRDIYSTYVQNSQEQLTRHYGGHHASYDISPTMSPTGQVSQSKAVWRPW